MGENPETIRGRWISSCYTGSVENYVGNVRCTFSAFLPMAAPARLMRSRSWLLRSEDAGREAREVLVKVIHTDTYGEKIWEEQATM